MGTKTGLLAHRGAKPSRALALAADESLSRRTAYRSLRYAEVTCEDAERFSGMRSCGRYEILVWPIVEGAHRRRKRAWAVGVNEYRPAALISYSMA